MLEVTNKIKLHEENTEGEAGIGQKVIYVDSHWNNDNLVVIGFPEDGITVTVSAKDLKAAIQNATNSARF